MALPPSAGNKLTLAGLRASGSLPPALTSLTLAGNAMGCVPDEEYLSECGTLRKLDLSSTGLCVSPPEWIWVLTLSELFLDDNQIRDIIPAAHGATSMLVLVSLKRNQIGPGALPSSFFDTEAPG